MDIANRIMIGVLIVWGVAVSAIFGILVATAAMLLLRFA